MYVCMLCNVCNVCMYIVVQFVCVRAVFSCMFFCLSVRICLSLSLSLSPSFSLFASLPLCLFVGLVVSVLYVCQPASQQAESVNASSTFPLFDTVLLSLI